MEGDVFGGWLAALYPFAVLAVAVISAVALLLRWFGARLLADIDRRMGRLDAMAADLTRIDNDLRRLSAELPLYYVRRDDHIRDITAIGTKLDRIYELLMRLPRDAD
jgi:hypothetical protein